ncbi:MAG: AraC family transcriptional regulator [Gammaproteobacteria bacterium]|nr:MAG: AraC family transcriptional regulator [Gammaproteobacteria bacterium]
MKHSTEVVYTERVMQAQNFIKENIDRDIFLDEVADIVAMSPYHFHRVFKEFAGEAVKEHIRRLRLEKAAEKLITTKMPLKQIAQHIRYHTVEAFSRAFKNQYDLSPGAYRKKNKQNYESSDTYKVEDINIQQLQPENVAYVKKNGGYNGTLKSLHEILRFVRRHGIESTPTECFSMFDFPSNATSGEKLTASTKNISHQLCLKTSNYVVVTENAEITTKRCGGGLFAVYTDRSGSKNRNKTIAWLVEEWLPQCGYKMDNRMWRIKYHCSNGKLPSEDVVDICIPLKAI